MASSAFVPGPRSPTSHHLRSPSSHSHHPPAHHARLEPHYRGAPLESAPASQESSVSAFSAASSYAPKLQTSSSSVSHITNYSDSTSPTSSQPLKLEASPKDHFRAGLARLKTPDENSAGAPHPNNDYIMTSPMSVTSPVLANGAKRTASGHVKNASSVSSTITMTTPTVRHSRGESMSSTSSRAGELAADLKTRLGYAMAKVQHGWEHKNFVEVERLAAQRMSPSRHSMSHIDHNRRPWTSGHANGTSPLPSYDVYASPRQQTNASPPSKRHSTTFASYDNASQPPYSSAPQLQPPVDLRPTTSYKHAHSASSSQNHSQPTNATVMSPPRTPVNGYPRRPPTIRTQTQTAEAERDALQALFQLGSPHTSQVSRNATSAASQDSSSQASPLRSDSAPTPRRVTFARSDSGGSSDSRFSSTVEHRMSSASEGQVIAEA